MPIEFSLRRLIVPALVLCIWAQGAVAADETPADVPEAAVEVAADGNEEAAPAGTVAGQMGEVSLEEFVPSEEISADGAVSFPVDI